MATTLGKLHIATSHFSQDSVSVGVSEISSRLIETAVRPLTENVEQRLVGAAYLESLQDSRTGGEAVLIQRWDEVDAATFRVRWRLILLAVVVVLAGWVGFTEFENTRFLLTARQLWNIGYGFSTDQAEERIARKLTPAQQLLVFGDLTKSDQLGRKEGLWRSDPENPGFYIEYAIAFASETSHLPPDFLETARRIDPENAWFTYFAAAVEAQDCVVKKYRKGTRVSGKMTYSEPIAWEIKDQARLDRALTILRETRNQTKYETYQLDLLKRRVALLPHGNLIESLASSTCLGEVSRSPGIPLRHLVNAMAAKAWTAGEEKNATALRKIVADGDKFLRASAAIPPQAIVEELVISSNAVTLAQSFGPALENIGFPDEAKPWHQIEERLQEFRDSRGHREFKVDGKVVPDHLKTDLLSSVELLARQTAKPPPLTDSDLRPGRMIEREILSRFCCYAAWVLLAVMSGLVALYRCRLTRVVRCLARRMECQLDAVDWGWMVGLGVVLPLIYVLAVDRLTPWGGRDYGLKGTLMLLPMAQFLGLLVLWCCAPLPVIQWRLRQRLVIFGYGGGSRWLDGLAIVCAAAFVPVNGWAAMVGTIPALWIDKLNWRGVTIDGRATNEMPLWLAVGLLGLPVLCLLTRMGMALLSGHERLLYRASTARAMIPVFASAMVAILAVTPVFKLAERHWFAQEHLMKMDPAYPAWSHYEYLIAVELHKELAEATGYGK